MSDSVRPHRWQPTRLRHPWDSPGKNTGVGCHFLLQCRKVKVKSLSCVWPSATPWTAAFQAPPSMGFSRQEYWSGVPLPSPDLETEQWPNAQSRWPMEHTHWKILIKSGFLSLIEYFSLHLNIPKGSLYHQRQLISWPETTDHHYWKATVMGSVGWDNNSSYYYYYYPDPKFATLNHSFLCPRFAS